MQISTAGGMFVVVDVVVATSNSFPFDCNQIWLADRNRRHASALTYDHDSDVT